MSLPDKQCIFIVIVNIIIDVCNLRSVLENITYNLILNDIKRKNHYSFNNSTVFEINFDMLIDIPTNFESYWNCPKHSRFCTLYISLSEHNSVAWCASIGASFHLSQIISAGINAAHD